MEEQESRVNTSNTVGNSCGDVSKGAVRDEIPHRSYMLDARIIEAGF